MANNIDWSSLWFGRRTKSSYGTLLNYYRGYLDSLDLINSVWLKACAFLWFPIGFSLFEYQSYTFWLFYLSILCLVRIVLGYAWETAFCSAFLRRRIWSHIKSCINEPGCFLAADWETKLYQNTENIKLCILETSSCHDFSIPFELFKSLF